MDIEYLGEHALVGRIGHLLVILSFVAALFSAYSYIRASRDGDDTLSWRNLGRIGFRVHTAALFGLIALVFFIIAAQYFEYDYVWKHSNRAMPGRYIFACFWEGQEGSNMLWAFWHAVLGNILIRVTRNWESPVLAVFSLVQVFLTSMLLGVYVLGVKVGSSPFILIRELPDNIGLPWTSMANYLTTIPAFADGRGLNPLLQNYWMTIHPPTLFLGFSSTLVPFSFAIAGLWKRKFTEWIAPALPWTYFGVAVLGTGILMGGAWAYEALSFGGFWAWDPVENASLVPWITLVSGAHLMLINKRKPTSLWTTFFLLICSFVLVLYSSFLTKSGVLGETSVHSFTGEGGSWQLLLFVLFFAWLGSFFLLLDNRKRIGYAAFSALLLLSGFGFGLPVVSFLLFGIATLYLLLISYNKHFPKEKEEENLWSREFWVFIGSTVLLISAAQITISTSIPVINLLLEPFQSTFASLHSSTGWDFFHKLEEASFAPPSDVKTHYANWQTPIAFVITMLIAVGQYFKYKQNDMKLFARKMALPVVVAFLLTLIVVWGLDFRVKGEIGFIALAFSCIFAITANLGYFLKVLKGKLNFAGASIAHIGFGLLLLGTLLSTAKSRIISANSGRYSVEALSEDFNNHEEIMLELGDTLFMTEYFVSYRGYEIEGINQYCNVDFFEAIPRKWQKGDTVLFQDAAYVATANHEATSIFALDKRQYWDTIVAEQFWEYPFWEAATMGKFMFTLRPFIQLNEKFGDVAEPSTKHYLTKDLYTHLKYFAAKNDVKDNEFSGWIGDTIITSNFLLKLDTIAQATPKQREGMPDSSIAAYVGLSVLSGDSVVYTAEPMLIQSKDTILTPDFTVEDIGLTVSISNIDPFKKKVTFNIAEPSDQINDFIVMQAIVFPYINILWLGCLVMVIGTAMAIGFRIKQNKRTAAQ